MTPLIKSLDSNYPLQEVIKIGIVTWCQKSSKLSSSSNCSLKPLIVTCKTWKWRNVYNADRHLWLNLWYNKTSFFTDFYVECTSTRTVGIKRKALGQLEKIEVWDSYETVTKLNEKERGFCVAPFITRIGVDMLEVHNSHSFPILSSRNRTKTKIHSLHSSLFRFLSGKRELRKSTG